LCFGKNQTNVRGGKNRHDDRGENGAASKKTAVTSCFMNKTAAIKGLVTDLLPESLQEDVNLSEANQ
jgi:hypothetical protein